MMLSRRLIAAAALLLAACSTEAQPARQQAPSDVVATVGSTSITLAEVDEVAMQQPAGSFGSMPLSQALYEARKGALEAIVAEHLINLQVKETGVDRAALIEREITAKVTPPSDAEVAAWYQANPSRVQGAPLDQVRGAIRDLLIRERTQEARAEYLDTLTAKHPVKVMLEPPRLEVAEAGRPARGPENAPVQIVEFSDFECPFCLRAFPTVQQLLSTYGDRVRFVYRHYPLPNHPNARPAAEASACAHEQGKFWEYHDRLFAAPGKLSAADLKTHATELGLNAAQFNACVDSRKYQKDVEADIEAAQQVGVTGTPAFFINGRPLSGAQPFEAFKRIIDEELSR
jgi:protein-disulfide isomerase